MQSALDKIKDKYGSDIIYPASLGKNNKEWYYEFKSRKY
jgi:hypothetical protein